MTPEMRSCPGCGLEMPRGSRSYDRKFHASAECWSVFEEVLARQFQDPILFGRVHQLTVDAYAVQHAGGVHPDKSVCIHLVGWYLALERDVPPARVAPLLQRIAARDGWPHVGPPAARAALTVRDVAAARTRQAHAEAVRRWASAVWRAWDEHHAIARDLASAMRKGR